MALTPEPLAPWARAQDEGRLYFNGTAVWLAGKGVLILGPSGSGKSTLALSLMVQGAELISDDGVWLDAEGLHRPGTAPPLVEARGVGLLHAGPIRQGAPLSLVVDLSRPEPERLPPRRMATALDQKAPLILGAGQTTLDVSIVHLLRFGRADV